MVHVVGAIEARARRQDWEDGVEAWFLVGEHLQYTTRILCQLDDAWDPCIARYPFALSTTAPSWPLAERIDAIS